MLGHQVNKCNGLQESYNKKTITKFKEWLKKIPEFRTQIRERAAKIATGAAKTQAEIMSQVMKEGERGRERDRDVCY